MCSKSMKFHKYQYFLRNFNTFGAVGRETFIFSMKINFLNLSQPQRSPAPTAAARSSQEQPGGARSSQDQPGGARSGQQKPGGEEEPGRAIRNIKK